MLILLLGLLMLMTTVVDSLPTPSSVNDANNPFLQQHQQRQRSLQENANVDHYYFEDNDDQLLSDTDLWLKLCGSKKKVANINTSYSRGRIIRNSNPSSSSLLPVDNDNDKITSEEQQQQFLLESLFQQILRADNRNGLVNSNKLVSVTCEEEPLLDEEEQEQRFPQGELTSSSKDHQNKLLFYNEDENGDESEEEGEESLKNEESFQFQPPSPFFDSDSPNVQRQVIFIQIPETMINLHVHQPPQPQTAIYVLQPEDEHLYKITDYRNYGGGGKQNGLGGKRAATATDSAISILPTTTAVHFLTNFGQDKINNFEDNDNDTENTATRKQHNHRRNEANLNFLREQFQSINYNKNKNSRRNQNQNYQNQNHRSLSASVPVRGVDRSTVPASPITFPSSNQLKQQQQQRQNPTNRGIINGNNGANNVNSDFEIWPAVNGYFFN